MRLLSIGAETNSLTAGVEIDALATGDFTIVPSPFASGGLAYRLLNNAGSARNNRLSFKASSTQAAFFARVYVRIADYPTAQVNRFLLFCDASSAIKVGLRLNTDGTLELWNEEDSAQIGVDSAPLALNTDYCIEIKVDCTTLATTACEARINGVAFASGTANLSAGLARFLFGTNSAADASFDVYFDHIAINDNTGTFQNDYPGPGYLIHLKPNAAGDNNALATVNGGTVGAANNFTRVAEVTPDDATTYNADNTVDRIDDYNIETPAIGDGDIINFVATYVRFAGAAASANAGFKTRIKADTGGTVEESSEVTPASGTYFSNAPAAPFSAPLMLSDLPGASTSKWSKASLTTAQVGVRISTGNTNAARITTLQLQVEYVPGGNSIFSDEGLT